MGDELIFPRRCLAEILEHLRGDLSRERCGLLAGENGRVLSVLPVPNSLNSAIAYRMDGPEFVEALKVCDWEPLAIYHSHPHGPPVPSATDVAQAAYPDSIYVIVSFQVEPPSVRAFRIEWGEVREVEVRVENE